MAVLTGKYLFQFGNLELKPQDFISFTETYQTEVVLLKDSLQKRLKGDNVPFFLTTKRLDLKSGKFSTQYVYAKVISVSKDTFDLDVFYTTTSKEGGTRGKTVLNTPMTFRCDSYLAELPVLNDDTIPCVVDETKNKQYAAFLEEVITFLKTKLGTGEKFNFVYHNDFLPEEVTEYHYHGSVTEVNKSNIKVDIEYSYGKTSNGDIANNVPRKNVIRHFLTPTTMLIAIA
jgi:hypothetical protein